MKKKIAVGTILAILVGSLLQGCAKDGRDGYNGSNGVKGIDGINGVDGTNGTNGTNGLDAPPTQYTPIKLVLPCAVDPESPNSTELNNPNYEALIRLANNTLLASYSSSIDARYTHLAIVSPGTYTSTAAVSCTFTVNADGTVTR